MDGKVKKIKKNINLFIFSKGYDKPYNINLKAMIIYVQLQLTIYLFLILEKKLIH